MIGSRNHREDLSAINGALVALIVN
jgi:hypothetical protein